MKYFWILVLVLCNITFSQHKGIDVVPIKDQSGNKVLLYQKSYALLIGVSDYTRGWSDLASIPGELKKIEAALIKKGFKVKKVINPKSAELRSSFKNFIDQYGLEENNRLLFFFSGHGYSRKGQGFLVPADAPDPRIDKKGFLRKALRMGQIISWSKNNIEAKHAIFLFDSCFSGTIFKTRDSPEPPHISDIIARPVRQYISAGSANEKVPAKSVFVPFFIRALRGKADLNRDGYVTGTELGMYLHQEVMGYNIGQTPQYGKILDANLNEGDFVFKLQKTNATGKSFVHIKKERKTRIKSKNNLELFFSGNLEVLKWEKSSYQYAIINKSLFSQKITIRRTIPKGMGYRRKFNKQILTSNIVIKSKSKKVIEFDLLASKKGTHRVYIELLQKGKIIKKSVAITKVVTIDNVISKYFKYKRNAVYSCGGVTNRVREYVHRKTGMPFVLIPGGSFMMGSDNFQKTQPLHKVWIKPFLISKYEVSQKVWKNFMKYNPNQVPERTLKIAKLLEKLDLSLFIGDNKPVNVFYGEAQDFCLNANLDLPTEAQWEYACRAGTITKFYWGNSFDGDYCWYGGNSGGVFSSNTTQPVRTKKPNAFGLYNMSGNVYEICEDGWYKNHENAPSDGSARRTPLRDGFYVLKGGSYIQGEYPCRSALRISSDELYNVFSKDRAGNYTRFTAIGFRPVYNITLDHPAQIVKAFYGSLKRNNYFEAEKHVHFRLRKKINGNEIRRKLKKKLSLEITKEKISNEIAMVQCRFHINKKSYDHLAFLEKENSVWKLISTLGYINLGKLQVHHLAFALNSGSSLIKETLLLRGKLAIPNLVLALNEKNKHITTEILGTIGIDLKTYNKVSKKLDKKVFDKTIFERVVKTFDKEKIEKIKQWEIEYLSNSHGENHMVLAAFVYAWQKNKKQAFKVLSKIKGKEQKKEMRKIVSQLLRGKKPSEIRKNN